MFDHEHSTELKTANISFSKRPPEGHYQIKRKILERPRSNERQQSIEYTHITINREELRV